MRSAFGQSYLDPSVPGQHSWIRLGSEPVCGFLSVTIEPPPNMRAEYLNKIGRPNSNFVRVGLSEQVASFNYGTRKMDKLGSAPLASILLGNLMASRSSLIHTEVGCVSFPLLAPLEGQPC